MSFATPAAVRILRELARDMPMLGVPLGILIGLATGLAALLLIRTGWGTSAKELKGIVTLVAELLAIPTFWFGGPWVTSALLESVDVAAMLPSYMVSLAATFVAIAIFPLMKMIVQIGNDIGKAEGRPDA